jgi:hypothetical protein
MNLMPPLRRPFYRAKEASSLRKCAVRLALDEYLARVLSAELSFEEEHVDDGEEEDVDHHEQQVASVVLPHATSSSIGEGRITVLVE